MRPPEATEAQLMSATIQMAASATNVKLLTPKCAAIQGAAQGHIHEYGETHCERGLGAGAGDRERNPAIEKADQSAIGAAQVDVVAARLRHHGGDFRVGERAGQRQQSCGEPYHQHELGTADIAGHDPGLQEDAGADHVGDIDGRCGPRTHPAREFASHPRT